MNRIERAQVLAWSAVADLDSICPDCVVGLALTRTGRYLTIAPRREFAEDAPPEVRSALGRPARGVLVLVLVDRRDGGQDVDVVELRWPPREAA